MNVYMKVWYEDGTYKEYEIKPDTEKEFDTEIKKHGAITDQIIYFDT